MGRAAKFDRDLVLAKAMEVFWERGFRGSSMADLMNAMNLNPGSIYAAFGSKEDLLLACLERYSSKAQERFRGVWESSVSVKEAFLKIFDSIIEQIDSDSISRGCLLINTLLELGGGDELGGRAARKYLGDNQKLFGIMLEKARTSGELQSSRPTGDLAAFLLGTIFSLRVLSKAKNGRDTLESIRDQALEQVFG